MIIHYVSRSVRCPRFRLLKCDLLSQNLEFLHERRFGVFGTACVEEAQYDFALFQVQGFPVFDVGFQDFLLSRSLSNRGFILPERCEFPFRVELSHTLICPFNPPLDFLLLLPYI